MSPGQPVVVAARRTPFGVAGRSLAAFGPAQLAAPVLAALADDLKPVLAEHDVDEVVLGNCRGPGGDVARVAALAGLGSGVPGLSIDRQCGSGLEAVRLAAALVAAGAADVVLAGGTESASTAPGGPGHRARFTPDGWPDPEMGPAADAVARLRGIDRRRQDAYAARSHALALAARDSGAFDAELVEVGGLGRDERLRRALPEATLARLHPAFAADGTVTAGNACGVNDGAAVVAVVSERVRAAAGLPGLRVLAGAAVGGDPALPPLAAAPAVRAVLARAGTGLAAVDRFEITEAFAAQVLACTDELGLDPLGRDAHRVCPSGGAIAVGHPWSASGAFLVVRLLAALGGASGRLGLATCAVGGGQGVAMLFEGVG